MAKISMTASEDVAPPPASGGVNGATSPAPITNTVSPMLAQQIQVPPLGTLADVRQEIDDAYDDMKQFIQMEPDQIMSICAGHTARLNEIRTICIRLEDFIRQLKPVRINEIEPTIKELQFQFQVASRLFAVRQLDWDMVKGPGSGN